MCGIIGRVVREGADAIDTGLQALLRLEYRGYDSAGVATVSHGKISLAKKRGAIQAGLLPEVRRRQKAKKFPKAAPIAILHTRWATHGEANDANAHPHLDCSERIAVVHNGIIENYRELKEELIAKGHVFNSETDTEVLSHGIEEARKSCPDIASAIRKVLEGVRGTYGLLVISAEKPDTLFVAKCGSPILVGVGDGEYLVASDPAAILLCTRNMFALDDGELCEITASHHAVSLLNGHRAPEKTLETIEWSPEEAEKGGYAHFMLKEIMEQPRVIEDAFRGRLQIEDATARLGGLWSVQDALRRISSFHLVSCGTSFYAGLIGEYLLGDISGCVAQATPASEFRYKNPVLGGDSAIIALSQSGETADTLAALEEAKRKGALALGIVNVVGSTIARKTDAGVYTHAGPEVSVASTKAFTSQIAVLSLLSLYLGRQRNLSLSVGQVLARALQRIPDQIRLILERISFVEEVARKYASCENFFYLGRRYSFPVAAEGALKIKEIAYVHAEAYPAGEMKHGPLALVQEGFPSVFIIPKDSMYEKTKSNMQGVKARKGRILAVTRDGNTELLDQGLADDCLYIPETIEQLSPFLSVIPLQLFAYFVANARGESVDRPRNLAKSVTVE